MGRGPVEAGKDARERAGEIRHVVGYHRQPGVGEARRIAVGVEDDARALRLEAFQHARQNRQAADAGARLVAAAHPPRQPASENETQGRCRHSGARRRREPGIQNRARSCCLWIPGSALRAAPE
jgi:hypothetical protein